VSKFGKIALLVALALLLAGGDAWATQTRPPPESSAPCAEQIVPSDPVMIAVGEVSMSRLERWEGDWDVIRRSRFRLVDGGPDFRVEVISSDHILAILGVQQNDVVRSINGISLLKDIENFSHSWRSMMDGDQIVTEVIRDGALVLLRVDVKHDAEAEAPSSPHIYISGYSTFIADITEENENEWIGYSASLRFRGSRTNMGR